MDITERTKVPLFALVIAIATTVPTLVGCLMWITSVYYQGTANASEIARQEKEIQILKTDIRDQLTIMGKLIDDTHDRVVKIEARGTP